jgi:hypothetical protein
VTAVAYVVRKRPVRGALAGLLVGLGAALMVMLYDLSIPGDLVLIGGVVLGLLLGLYGPTRGKGRVSADDDNSS